MNKKVLVVVAHPDDETIWMGGTLLMNCDWDVKIVSLCRKDDLDRAPKFARVCKALGAKESLMNDLDDETMEELSVDFVKKKIGEVVDFSLSYDLVFTHGANGEYGHKRHKDVHKAVKKLFVDGVLKTKELKFFSYEESDVYVENNTNLNLMIPRAGVSLKERFALSKEILKRKVELVRDMYGFKEDTFEVVTTKNLKEESFDMGFNFYKNGSGK